MQFFRLHGAFLAIAALAAAAQPFGHTETQQLLKTKCLGCHTGKTPAGEFDVAKLMAASSLRVQPAAWTKAAVRVHNGEMPPKAPLPLDQREAFAAGCKQQSADGGVLGGNRRPDRPRRGA